MSTTSTEYFKKYWKPALLAVLVISLDVYHHDSSLTLLLAYYWFIRLLLSGVIRDKHRKILGAVIGAAIFLQLSFTYYVNYYLPHGPMYDTGDVVCQNDDRGPCGPAIREDLSDVDIPEWAKFLRTSGAWLLLAGMIFAEFVIYGKSESDSDASDAV